MVCDKYVHFYLDSISICPFGFHFYLSIPLGMWFSFSILETSFSSLRKPLLTFQEECLFRSLPYLAIILATCFKLTLLCKCQQRNRNSCCFVWLLVYLFWKLAKNGHGQKFFKNSVITFPSAHGFIKGEDILKTVWECEGMFSKVTDDGHMGFHIISTYLSFLKCSHCMKWLAVMLA